MSDETLYDFEVVTSDHNGPMHKRTEEDRYEADSIFVREVQRVMETDYTNEVSVALIATAERPEYEEWVTLAEFTKTPIKEIH